MDISAWKKHIGRTDAGEEHLDRKMDPKKKHLDQIVIELLKKKYNNIRFSEYGDADDLAGIDAWIMCDDGTEKHLAIRNRRIYNNKVDIVSWTKRHKNGNDGEWYYIGDELKFFAWTNDKDEITHWLLFETNKALRDKWEKEGKTKTIFNRTNGQYFIAVDIETLREDNVILEEYGFK